MDIAIQTPVSLNTRRQPAECYILDALNLYVCGVTKTMTPHYKEVAKRMALLIDGGKIKRKTQAVGGRGEGLRDCLASFGIESTNVH